MLSVRRLLIVPAVLGAILFAASLQFGSAPVKAGSPSVVVPSGGGLLCSNGVVAATLLNCSTPIAPYAPGYNCPPQCPVYPSTYYNYPANFFYSYNFPLNWQYYVGASWQWCIWPGGSGWALAGTATAVGALC